VKTKDDKATKYIKRVETEDKGGEQDFKKKKKK
jgi:hypothetical protein